ncbi:family 2A encapsulin nanocompartment cargo protein cysteine desulfurase [Pseudomonas sp. 5P_3.1_Bac2]|uniref:family 2A encapsulin nanocompartment cargo protein cysteine desulfurase n=1 Tax=Pseudomonas sp. 5P_3.1_Bac2 TaxID=2971617 RepID=UPI0021CA8F1F|nr:family 2A encapsulin nanocompartment cargo protein cysteine desulfurase [Pseudomonas sp. 5P_3.1_Bac2]MCU1716665.1 SufS family cysteine desulfurase [Pseudomonas sp. 5P_3.1_Bac2]
MTIQTPTSNPGAGGEQAAAGLPDIGALSRLANEFFASLPGAPTPGVSGLAVPSQAAPSAGGSAPGAASPSLQAHEPAQQGLPAGTADGYDLGTPQAYTAAIPQVYPGASIIAPNAGGVPAPSAFYFANNQPAAGAPTQDVGQEPESTVQAQSFGLPGGAELAQIVQGIVAGQQPQPLALGTGNGPQSGGQFYFLEQAGASQPGQGRGSEPRRPEQGRFDSGSSARLQPAPAGHDRPQGQSAFDVHAVRRDFPILSERVNGKPLVWFDNAATTQKPQVVIDRLAYFYQHENSNIHRAAHELAARATDAYEGARNTAARFLGARSSDEIIFVRGATEGINLVANTFGRKYIGAGDEIIVSHLEHHANIVPWQQLAAEVGAKIKVIPVDDSGQIILEEFIKLLCSRTKLVAITQVSNALGTVTPVAEIIALAHGVGARVLVDGAQSVSHLRVNVQALGADFFIFSGHKIFGPTGIGVVYGKADLLATLPPWQGGGNMIADVTFEKTQYQPAPARFEAGTGNIADAVGLGAALDYVERIGLENIYRYEHDLLVYATHGLRQIPGLRLIGTAAHKASVLSFVLDGYRTEEVGAALNREGIAVRSGHHCAQPILRRFGVEATVRPSLAFYNTYAEVDLLVDTVQRLARYKR